MGYLLADQRRPNCEHPVDCQSLWPADQEALADQIGAVDRRDHEFGDVGEADPRRHEAGAMAIAVHAFAHQRGLGKEGLQIVHEKHGAEYNRRRAKSEEHTSELQLLIRISYAVFYLKKTNIPKMKEKYITQK